MLTNQEYRVSVLAPGIGPLERTPKGPQRLLSNPQKSCLGRNYRLLPRCDWRQAHVVNETPESGTSIDPKNYPLVIILLLFLTLSHTMLLLLRPLL